DSGERKTTLDSFFLRAIRQYEAEARQKAEPELEAYQAKLAVWKAEKEGLEGAIRQAATEGADLSRFKERFEEHYLSEPAAPRVPRLLRGDSTSEALAFSLAKHWPSAGIVQSEAGLFLGSHAMGPEKIMAALSLLNSFWDGSDYTAERRSTESFTVLKPRLTVALQLQEPALRAFSLSRGDLPRGIGFFARFLFARPKSTQGTRTYCKAPQAWPALSAFERRLIALLESTKPLDDNGMLQLSMLTLDEAAEVKWIALYDQIEFQLAEGKRYYDVRDVAAKAADNIARLAALFHLFEHGPNGRISAATIDAAGSIVLWHLNEARRFFGDFARPAEFVAARELEEWLLRCVERAPGHPPSLCSIQQLVTPKYLRQRKALDKAVQALTELGRARLLSDGKQKFIEIRPLLLNRGTAL
ncbi:MAG: YfjI family protein, partial [Rhodomicrobium sp.]